MHRIHGPGSTIAAAVGHDGHLLHCLIVEKHLMKKGATRADERSVASTTSGHRKTITNCTDSFRVREQS